MHVAVAAAVAAVAVDCAPPQEKAGELAGLGDTMNASTVAAKQDPTSTTRSAPRRMLAPLAHVARNCPRPVGLSAMRSGTNPQMMVAAARQSMDRSATFSRTIRRVRSARRSRVADGYDS